MNARAGSALAALLLASCSQQGGSPQPPTVTAPSPTPTPSLSPTPAPTPSPTPSPSPSPSPSPTAQASYIRFSDIYIYRLGSGVTVSSACSSLTFPTQQPVVRAVTPFGQGLSFRFVVTPQVWAIGGDGIALNFDGRTADASNPAAELSYGTSIDGVPVRFSVTRPVAGVTGLDYARLASVSLPVAGVIREYRCVTGIPTLAADLAAAPSGDYARTVLIGTAYQREGEATRALALQSSTATLAADPVARRVTLSVRLIGTPQSGGGADVDLGTYAATVPIDPATDNFVAPLTGGDGNAIGTISGRFFGPQATEVGVAFGASVAAQAARPAFSAHGALYAIR